MRFKRQGFANARLSALRKVGTFAAPQQHKNKPIEGSPNFHFAGFGIAKTEQNSTGIVGEPSHGFIYEWVGLAKVQGDRKALPLKALSKQSTLPGARAVPIGLKNVLQLIKGWICGKALPITAQCKVWNLAASRADAAAYSIKGSIAA